MERQTIGSKKSEIEFRKKLAEQQVEGKTHFRDEFSGDKMQEILYQRMEKTLSDISPLKDSGIEFTPYIEIGAERCQRSLVMENDLGASGAAVDISFSMLKSCDHYRSAFKKSKNPARICCDAHNLPFLSGSLAFAFSYEVLHHFPDPAPIIKEMHRVLSPGGYFYFNEEPYKKILHLNLYKKKHMYSADALKTGAVRKIFDYFFAQPTCNEVECGILENDDISVGDWKRALAPFDEKKVRLRSMKMLETPLFGPSNVLKRVLAQLLGGEISGVCVKTGVKPAKKVSLYDALACPSCLENGREESLKKTEPGFRCGSCGAEFKSVDGVLFLFTDKMFKELYPELHI
jgi:SAM-dependent methyltransferase